MYFHYRCRHNDPCSSRHGLYSLEEKYPEYRINTEFAFNSENVIIDPSLDNAQGRYFLKCLTGLLGMSWTRGATTQCGIFKFLAKPCQGLNIERRSQ